MAQAERRSITRRTLVAAALIPAALPAPLCTAPADLLLGTDAHPRGDADIEALLAAHGAAVAAVETAARHLCDVEEGLVDDGGQDRGNGPDDDPLLTVATAAFDAACNAETRTAWALARARPTDPAAAAALLRHVGDVEAEGHDWPETPEDDGDRNWSSTFHHNLAAALDGMKTAPDATWS